MTKNTESINLFDRIYSSVFSVVILILLISFISSSELSLSTISTDYRWRSNLIDMYTSLRLNIGDRVFNNAVIGEDGWVFYTGEKSIQDYQNTDPLNKQRLAFLQTGLGNLHTDLEKRGITLLIVIPPNKQTVYSQYMPDEIPVLGQKSRLDQFIEHMNLNENITIIDLRKILVDASQARDIYFKTDTHWNDTGAYYGYVAVMNSLSSDYPNLTPHPLSDFGSKNAGETARDLPVLMGLPNYKEENHILVPKFEVKLNETSEVMPDGVHYIRTVTNNDDSFPKLLVFSDSFYMSLAHFIEPHFSRVKNVPFSPNSQIWAFHWIEQENPNVVIIEFVERYLDVSLPALIRNSINSP